MAQNYIEYNFKVSPLQPGTEILIAELGFAGFESFVETEDGVTAYIQQSLWNENILDDIGILNSKEFQISYEQEEIEQVNWNEEWEKNFDPIVVSDQCLVRAPFHPSKDVNYEIVIEPKMSFGTGHHETTFMMLQYILENDFAGKTVLDMGCGTAVLAILAKMKGAKSADAIDIDEWCVENSKENIERNNVDAIQVRLGDASILPKKKYDIVLANINRNILLNDMDVYVKSLLPGGILYMSGFYLSDLTVLTKKAEELGLKFIDNRQNNNWVAAKFELTY